MNSISYEIVLIYNAYVMPEVSRTLKMTAHAQFSLALVSGKWSVHIVSVLGHDIRRFSEIQKATPKAAQKVLSETLKKLERDGLLERTPYPTIPPQAEYKLTPLGLELLKLCEVLSDWAAKHEEEVKRAQKAYGRRTS